MLYSLSPFAYVRIEPHGVLWLNVREDRYIGQRRSDVRGLYGIVKGWRLGRDDTATGDAAIANAERLVARGLIVRGDSGRSADPPTLLTPRASFRREIHGIGPLHHILRFRTASRAISRVRGRSLEYALDHTRERKAGRVWSDSDFEHAQQLITAFHQLRAFWYGSHNECLRDSLTLMEYLAGFDLHPTLVIGVTLRPFSAHCWVQAGDCALNDHHSNVQRYAPILAI